MRYIEIGQDIVDAIRGGANWDGKSDADEAVEALGTYSNWFAEVITIVFGFFDFLKEIFNK